MIFGVPAAVIASVILILSYAVLFSEKLNRAVAVMLGAAAMVLLGVLSYDQALKGIDFNTIALLIGMMIMVGIMEKSGAFQYAAVKSAKLVKANPRGILAVLGVVTAVLSAFLDNVTTVLLVVPVTMQIANKLEVNPYPYLLINIFASNIGGTATLIGDPPNILIGSALELSFTDFLFHLTPVVLTIMAAVVGMFVYFWKDSLTTSLKNRALVMNINEKDAITDFKLLKKALWVLGMVMAAFVVAHDIGFENGFIALAGAAVMLLLYTMGLPHTQSDEKVEDVLRRVDWTTVFFFVGLFVIVGALDESGFLKKMGDYFVGVTGGSIKKSVYVILGVSAAASAVVDNIPFVATMIPTLKAMEEALGGREAMMPVWWALSLGACLGGNGTLIGASANVIVAGIAAREGHPISFLRFLIWSVPVMLLSVAMAGVFLYLEYFI